MAELRKLATIMSVDVAGYSRMAEASDSVAAEAVGRLKEALAAIAAPLSGRIFNTAGDGVMLEFPVASAGVQAAVQLLAETKSGERPLPQVRVGLHLGEVIVAENGDLLGHGVNVAARLQALAAPGTAMVSLAVQSQVRSAASVAFLPRGRVHLDKMAETMEVFTLGAPGEKVSTSLKLRLRQALRPPALAAAFVLVLLAALFILTRAPAPDVGSTPSISAPRLAVLRFETLGGTEAYFAEGVADELISEASRIPGLEVTARASSFALVGARQTPSNAARELGATLVLTGAVRLAPDAIHVNAQLSEAPSGRLIWSRTFQRPENDAYGLQRDIAVDVARAAGLRVTAGQPRHVEPEAFRLYLRGRDVSARHIDAHVEEARDLFRAATERDPSFADAWGWLAKAEYVLAGPENYKPGPGNALTPQMFAAALQSADRALALDPSLPSPYQAREGVFVDLGRWKEAVAAGDAAEARGGRAFTSRTHTGHVRATLHVFRKHTELNPLDHIESFVLSYTCYEARDYPCAIKAARRSLELEPRYGEAGIILFVSQLLAGDRAGASQTLDAHGESLRQLQATYQAYDIRYLKSLIGVGPQVPASELISMLNTGNAHLDDVLWMLAMMGRTRDAAALLPRWGPGDRRYMSELFEPGLADLRRTPEFWATMDRVGLTAYWHESGNWPDFCATENVCPR